MKHISIVFADLALLAIYSIILMWLSGYSVYQYMDSLQQRAAVVSDKMCKFQIAATEMDAEEKRINSATEAYWLSFYRVCLFVNEDKGNVIDYCDDQVKSGYSSNAHLAKPPLFWDFAKIISQGEIQ